MERVNNWTELLAGKSLSASQGGPELVANWLAWFNTKAGSFKRSQLLSSELSYRRYRKARCCVADKAYGSLL